MRGSRFNASDIATLPPVNFPATDEPAAGWYGAYLRQASAIEE